MRYSFLTVISSEILSRVIMLRALHGAGLPGTEMLEERIS